MRIAVDIRLLKQDGVQQAQSCAHFEHCYLHAVGASAVLKPLVFVCCHQNRLNLVLKVSSCHC